MIFLAALLNAFINLAGSNRLLSTIADPCEQIRSKAIAVTLFTKDSIYRIALAQIKIAFVLDTYEHCISFGKDAADNIIASPVSNGSATSGKVPAIANSFADLHNHPNHTPPDAGDFYGLADINKNNPRHNTRFVVTVTGMVYALLVTDTTALRAFILKYPRQPPAFTGGPPGFATAIVDESREMKYQYHCTDEMVLAFILEKYNTGISLLKQQNNGNFNKIITTVSKNGSQQVFSAGICS